MTLHPLTHGTALCTDSHEPRYCAFAQLVALASLDVNLTPAAQVDGLSVVTEAELIDWGA